MELYLHSQIRLHGVVLNEKKRYVFMDPLDDRGSVPSRGRVFFLRYRVQAGSGAHPAYYPMGTGGLFPRDKAVGM